MSLDRFCKIPFRAGGRDESGCDCWGLFRLVFAHLTGIALPAYADVPAGVAYEEAAAIRAAVASGDWAAVEAPQPCDAALMWARQEIDGERVKAANHVGLVVPGNQIIQTYPDRGVLVTKLSHSIVRRDLIGFYRHKALA